MTEMDMVKQFLLLMMMHALTDIALQSHDFVRLRMPFKPQWYYFMMAHAMINGLGVYYITDNVWVACAEIAVHFTLDTLKMTKRINIHADALGHVISKIVWAVV
jgi:hypothetical protein